MQSRAVVYRDEQRPPDQRDLGQSASTASLAHSDQEKKTLGQSISVTSLMTTMSDTSGGPSAVAPPRTSQTALGHGEVLQPYLPAAPLASTPAVPLGSDHKSPSVRALPPPGRDWSQTAQPMGLEREPSPVRTAEASAVSPAQQKCQAGRLESLQPAGASTGYQERGSNRACNMRVVEPQPVVPQRDPRENVPRERETHSANGATWVIEEVIDFGVPVDEGIHEVDDPGFLHACKPKALRSSRNGIFDGCVRTLCAEEAQAKPGDDFC